MSKSSKQDAKKQHHHAFQAAFLKTAALRAALKPEELYRMNLDARAALASVLGNLAQLEAYREEMIERLPETHPHLIDHVKLFAEALAFANADYLAASQPAEPLPAIQARAAERRDILLGDAQTLARRGLLDGKPLEELKKAPGYLNTGSDLGALVRILRGNWGTIEGKCAIALSELDEAELLFERITYAYGEREQPGARVTAAADERQRAYTLFVRTYDEVRRAMTYLRWHQGDADKIAPSLWAGRGGRGTPAPPPVAPEPTPSATPAQGPVGSAVEEPAVHPALANP